MPSFIESIGKLNDGVPEQMSVSCRLRFGNWLTIIGIVSIVVFEQPFSSVIEIKVIMLLELGVNEIGIYSGNKSPKESITYDFCIESSMIIVNRFVDAFIISIVII